MLGVFLLIFLIFPPHKLGNVGDGCESCCFGQEKGKRVGCLLMETDKFDAWFREIQPV